MLGHSQTRARNTTESPSPMRCHQASSDSRDCHQEISTPARTVIAGINHLYSRVFRFMWGLLRALHQQCLSRGLRVFCLGRTRGLGRCSRAGMQLSRVYPADAAFFVCRSAAVRARLDHGHEPLHQLVAT